MTAATYTIDINATPKQVWHHMLSDAGYRDWTTPFCVGSHYQGSWEQGATIRFLTPSGQGMVSRINENRLYEFVSIQHLGMVQDGKDDTTSAMVKAWGEVFENYTFTPTATGTRVTASLSHLPEAWADFMNATWPKALARLKARSEQGAGAVTAFLWFNDNAEAAVQHYVATFADAHIKQILRVGEGGPGPAGSVLTIDFSLNGSAFTALNGGTHYTFSPATSFMIHCDTQAEIDHYWSRLGEGGTLMSCGWLTDRFGVTWQVVPRRLLALLHTEDAGQHSRVMAAMMTMVKLDLAALEQAALAPAPH